MINTAEPRSPDDHFGHLREQVAGAVRARLPVGYRALLFGSKATGQAVPVEQAASASRVRGRTGWEVRRGIVRRGSRAVSISAESGDRQGAGEGRGAEQARLGM